MSRFHSPSVPPWPGQPSIEAPDSPAIPRDVDFPRYRYVGGGRVRPEVSVCIVNWNCRELLRGCLESLSSARQGVRTEVIVVDNGSSDGAADMVATDFPDVKLIRNVENEGFARSNNQAARRSCGRYLFFLNNDTVVPPGTLRRLRDHARAHPEIGLLGPQLVDGRGRTQSSARGKPTVEALLHRVSWLRWTGLFRTAYRKYRGRVDNARERSVEVLMGAALFMPRKVYRECGKWDESYTFGGEDVDLCLRVGQRYQVIYHPDVALTHFGRASSRQHIGYVHTNTVIGTTRLLRQCGASAFALACYKLVVTVDVPIQWLGHAARRLLRRVRGQHLRAERSRLGMHAIEHFLTRGLMAFWKA
jgi:N-acetylglucosaminyl-diphospho-decaprenol L-rhamnosyltransferase